jgi:hypothetical protein
LIFFVLPPLVIAGMVLIATWNLGDAVIAFRVAFLACPVCGPFILADRGPEGIALLFIAVVFAIFWSRVMRLPSGVDYLPPNPPPPVPPRSDTLYTQIFEPTPPTPSAPPTPGSMSCMVVTVAPVERRPPRIAEMQGGELWTRGPGGWQMERIDLAA